MDKGYLLLGVFILLALYSIPTMIIAADQSIETKLQRRIPYPPPPPLAPCPPMPPGVDMKQDCRTPTLEGLRKKYLETEGATNRGLNFYYYAGAFFGQHKFYDTDSVNQSNYSFNTQTIFEELGPPDYQKALIKNNETIEMYAYIFNYKSNKDYVMIVDTANSLVYRTGSSETELIIDDSWETFRGR